MKNIIITIITIGFIFSNECKEPENIWFKVSNNQEHMYGKLMAIDMSGGFATTDGEFIYLIVYEKSTNEEIVITFPIGYWSVGNIDKPIPKKKSKKEEFDLDEYLKKNKGKGKIINASIK
tara:strand:+ start:992 stop:1351 length:360 start_codon:yes stop_codon:yes gene_type:complete